MHGTPRCPCRLAIHFDRRYFNLRSVGQLAVAGIAVDLKNAFKALQMGDGPFGLPDTPGWLATEVLLSIGRHDPNGLGPDRFRRLW